MKEAKVVALDDGAVVVKPKGVSTPPRTFRGKHAMTNALAFVARLLG